MEVRWTCLLVASCLALVSATVPIQFAAVASSGVVFHSGGDVSGDESFFPKGRVEREEPQMKTHIPVVPLAKTVLPQISRPSDATSAKSAVSKSAKTKKKSHKKKRANKASTKQTTKKNKGNKVAAALKRLKAKSRASSKKVDVIRKTRRSRAASRKKKKKKTKTGGGKKKKRKFGKFDQVLTEE